MLWFFVKIEPPLYFSLLRIPSTPYASSKPRRRRLILFIHQPHNNHPYSTILHHPKAPAHHLPWTALSDYHHCSSAYPRSCRWLVIWHEPDSWHPPEIRPFPSSAGPSTSSTASSTASSRILHSKGHGWHILASNTARTDSEAAVPCRDTGYGSYRDRFSKVPLQFSHPVFVNKWFGGSNLKATGPNFHLDPNKIVGGKGSMYHFIDFILFYFLLFS